MDARADLDRGRAAWRRRDWDEAYNAFMDADAAGGLEPDDLWRLGVAAYLTARPSAFESALERAHLLHAERNDAQRAARLAFWLGFGLAQMQEMARATGWFARAARLLERCPEDCVERGYLLLPPSLQQLDAGAYERAYAGAADALEIGARFGDADLTAIALNVQGRALLGMRQLGAGLALLDEAMTHVQTDELSPQVTGLIYCSMIGACRRVYALGRAHEWTTALTQWCERQVGLVPFTGHCLAYRAEMLQLHGAWQAALEEARRAAERSAAAADVQAGALARYQEGDVHRLRGDFTNAEDAYREAARAGLQPQPGLALLRLAQGRVDAARTAITRALAEVDDPLRRARLLPAQIEILIAAGDLDGARAACAALQEIARGYEESVLGTVLDQACGAVELAAGNALRALAPLRSACAGWERLHVQHEIARVHILLGTACRQLGDRDAAEFEFLAARDILTRLGAAPDLERLAALDGAAAAVPPLHGLTPRERRVLALLATGRTNRAIAVELYISEKTVARHVSNIFSKLGISSRSAATAYAWQHGIAQPSA